MRSGGDHLLARKQGKALISRRCAGTTGVLPSWVRAGRGVVVYCVLYEGSASKQREGALCSAVLPYAFVSLLSRFSRICPCAIN